MRYRLNVIEDVTAFDEEGCDLPSLEDAIAKAVTGARSIIADIVLKGGIVNRTHGVEIVDEAGKVLQTIRFGDVLRVAT